MSELENNEPLDEDLSSLDSREIDEDVDEEESSDSDTSDDENDEEGAQHNQSWMSVTFWPPISSNSALVRDSENLASRDSITRKKPSSVARLKRSQLKTG